MQENQQLFSGLWLVSSILEESQQPAIRNQNRLALWRIFSTKKSATANRKKGFYTNRDPNKQEIGFIFV
jgi:hypothetical protein